MIYLYFLSLALAIVILLFSSKTFSPIPYFPSNKKDLSLIIKALNLKNNQVVVDLGAGDGIVIFEAAKKAYQKGLNTQFIAVEINPILILIMFFKKIFHPNKKNIKIEYSDIFKFNSESITNQSKKLLTFYLYLSPWVLDKITKNLVLSSQKKNIRVVSYMYKIKSLKNNKKKIYKGINCIYHYQLK